VHLGVGNFHRSHQAVYLDRLASLGAGDWAVTGVGFRSRAMKDALSPQDNLFLVVDRDGSSTQARVVGVLRRYLYAPDESRQVLAALSSPRTRLVTLTVTGNGYPVDAAGCLMDTEVQRDLTDPHRPSSTFGYLVEGLQRRRSAGLGGVTVLSCDNLPDSGATTRAATVALAQRRDPSLARWIEDAVRFPGAMVDRITPATTLQERRLVRECFGVDDRWPVVTEPFTQWVVEDDFVGVRPPLDEVGVQYVSDVTAYKQMKSRLLNGSHCALGYLGALSGYSTSSAAMSDPLIRAALRRLMHEEVLPLLPPLPGIDLRDYCDTLLRRFSNPQITDPLSRLCGRGSTKMPAYLLPSLRQARQEGRPHGVLALAVAMWMRHLRGVDCEGRAIDVQDARAVELRELAVRGGNDPRPLLSRADLFGGLHDDEVLVEELSALLVMLEVEGARACLLSLSGGHARGGSRGSSPLEGLGGTRATLASVVPDG
jgi:fructuronate reductase/mannitol 2-dehydrogenase